MPQLFLGETWIGDQAGRLPVSAAPRRVALEDEVEPVRIERRDVPGFEVEELIEQRRAVGIGRHGHDLVAIERRGDRRLPQRLVTGEILGDEQTANGGASRRHAPGGLAAIEFLDAAPGNVAQDGRELGLNEARTFGQRLAARQKQRLCRRILREQLGALGGIGGENPVDGKAGLGTTDRRRHQRGELARAEARGKIGQAAQQAGDRGRERACSGNGGGKAG